MFFIDLTVQSDERFDLAKFMRFVSGEGYDPLDSYFLRELPNLQSRGQYSVQNEAKRPDLISYRFYGTTNYWWIVMLYNNILSVEELIAGTVLEIPSEEDISRLFFRLRPLNQAQNG